MTYSERLYIMENKQKLKEQEEQEEQKRLKEIKKIERKKEQEREQKQYEKDLLLACERDLQTSFERIFESAKPQDQLTLNIVLSKLYKLEYRNGLIDEKGSSTLEKDYLDKNYDKILNRVYKKWQNNLKSIEVENLQVQAEEFKEEQEEQEEVQKNPIFKIIMALVFIAILLFVVIKWGLIILCGVGFIFFMMILMASKGK